MAEPKDLPSFGNFSIQDEDYGGDRTLLEGLLGEETATTAPDKIEPITEADKLKPKEKEKKDENQEKLKSLAEKKREADEAKRLEQEALVKGLTDEKEESEEEITEKVETPESEDTDNQELNKFEALSKDLFKLNVFTKDEDEEDVEIKTPEDFLERFNYEKKKGASQEIEGFISRFGEDYQNAFQAIYVQGVDPKEYFTTYNNIVNISEMDLTKESNQEAVVRQFLTEQGLDQEDVTSELEKIKNYGDLEEKAGKYHKVLAKKEAQKLTQLEQDSKVKLQQQQALKAQYVQNVQNVLNEKLKVKDFDGIPLNPKFASEVQDFLISEKWKTPSGEVLTDFDKTILDLKRPENHATKVKVALLLKILEKDPTLSTIQKAAITKKTDVLFGEVAKQTSKQSVKSPKQQQSSWFSQ